MQTILKNKPKIQNDLLLEVIQDALPIKTHYELLQWLQGKVQPFLPHEILISAWGDFSLGLIYFDIVSSHPLLRTKNVSENTLTPQILKLFELWLTHHQTPQILNLNKSVFNVNSLFKDNQQQQDFLSFNFDEMKSVFIHGIKDNRGSYDCLYMLMNRTPISEDVKAPMNILMPFIDCAFRKIDQLDEEAFDKSLDDATQKVLTSREIEIMNLLKDGKTNRDIAEKLDISAFTVKNHLQHIYRKLNAISRSQAVNKYMQLL